MNFELKFVAMEQNIDDLYKVREFGNNICVPMVIILDVHPMSNGSLEPLQFRLTPEEAADFDFKDSGRSDFGKGVAKELLTGEIQMRPQKTTQRFEQGLYPCSVANQHVFITSESLANIEKTVADEWNSIRSVPVFQRDYSRILPDLLESAATCQCF